MADWFDQVDSKGATAPAPVRAQAAPSSGDWFDQQDTHAPAPSEGSGWGPIAAGVGGLALAGGALALHQNPGTLGKIVEGANDLRRVSMLSGMAPLKSLLGNVGSSVYGSIERGSLAPLKEMLSPETVKDAVSAFKAGSNYSDQAPSTLSKFNIPGRVMGAFDTAAQNALQRAGYTSEESARDMLQTPLPRGVSERLKGPVADYLVPFRRTPFNQLLEGFSTMNPKNLTTTGEKLALGTSLASGAVTGAEAEDPKTIALGTAFSGRRGLPFALAAGVSRALTSGSKAKGMDVISGMSPVSDYSLGEGAIGPAMDPSRLIPKPAALSAYSYLRSLFGMEP